MVVQRNKETQLKSLKPHQQICKAIMFNVNENQLLQRETKVLDELNFDLMGAQGGGHKSSQSSIPFARIMCWHFTFMCRFVHVIRINISAIRSL